MALHSRTLLALWLSFWLLSTPETKGETATVAPRNEPAASSSSLDELWQAPGNTVVGEVKRVNVTKEELLQHLWFQSAPAALEDLLKKRAIQSAADSAGIHISPRELELRINEDVKRTRSKSFASLLRKLQMTEERYKGTLMANMLLEEYVRKQVKMDEKDFEGWVKVRYIYVADSGYVDDPSKRDTISAESKTKAEKVFKEAVAGENFAELANQYSDSPENVIAGKKQGGYLGWVTHNQVQFAKSFEEACFTLKAGGVSNPVRADFGWYVIKAEAVGKDTHGKDGELNRLIVERKVRPLIESTLEKILADANLVNKLAMPHGIAAPGQ